MRKQEGAAARDKEHVQVLVCALDPLVVVLQGTESLKGCESIKFGLSNMSIKFKQAKLVV